MDTNRKKNFEGKRIFKSREDQIIDGVCGGVSDYLHADVTLIRALWIVSIFIFGIGILIYILFMIFVPTNPEHISINDQNKKKRSPAFFMGLFLLLFGGILLLRECDFPFFWPFRGVFRFPYWYRVSLDYIWPLMLIVLGIGYCLFILNKNTFSDSKEKNTVPKYKKLYRTANNKIVGGVCGGIGHHLGIDPTLIRIFFIVMTLFVHIFPGVILYIVLFITVPQKTGKRL